MKRSHRAVARVCFVVVFCFGALLAFREVPAAEFAVPEAEEFAVSAVLLRDAGPGLGRRAAGKVLVGADVVVEATKLDESVGQVGAIDDDLADHCLERAEESLDPAAHPRTRDLHDLKFHAEHAQSCAHQRGLQAGIVVDANLGREAELPNGLNDFAQDCQRAFVAEFAQRDARARAVVDDAEDEALRLRHVRYGREVQSPGPIARDNARHAVANLASQREHVGAALDEDAAHGARGNVHVEFVNEAAVEGLGEFHVAEPRPKRLHAHDFVADPARLGAGAMPRCA